MYHLDLEGGVRKNPALSGTAYNVFGIQVGVGITLAVRVRKHGAARLFFHRVEKTLRRAEKLNWLTKAKSVAGVAWEELTPDAKGNWFVTGHAGEFDANLPLCTSRDRASATRSKTIFKEYSPGVSTNRDRVAYDFDPAALGQRVPGGGFQ